MPWGGFGGSAVLYMVVKYTVLSPPLGGDLVPSLPIGVSEIWMEMGTFTSQMGADGVWPYEYAFEIGGHYEYNTYN